MNSLSQVHVFCARPFPPAQLERLRAVSPRLVIRQLAVRNRTELEAVLTPEIEVLFSVFPPVTVAKVPQLRWFQCRSAGMNAVIDTPLWHAAHIVLTNASGVHAVTMGEYTLGMMIALARDFLGFLSFQRRATWPMQPKNHHAQFPGRELRGATVLIVGYGSIGREIGRQCAALGLRVLAVKRDPSRRVDPGFAVPGTGDPAGTIPERIVGPGELAAVLPEAEYVVVTTALTPANRGLLGEAELRRMRPDAFLINVARGGVVDETALVRALRERWIAGAALDVFATEPLPPDSPFWGMENVIVSPHVSGVTPRYDEHVCTLFAENLRRYLAGEPLLNLVDRALGY
ncbi:MAG TPA: D-2-hydroxyacid dehydrogenase [Lacunisphaera sp.]|nr:D-2-hydroxyacid dehydrogenase [Lacunisphaera sp.]